MEGEPQSTASPPSAPLSPLRGQPPLGGSLLGPHPLKAPFHKGSFAAGDKPPPYMVRDSRRQRGPPAGGPYRQGRLPAAPVSQQSKQGCLSLRLRAEHAETAPFPFHLPKDKFFPGEPDGQRTFGIRLHFSGKLDIPSDLDGIGQRLKFPVEIADLKAQGRTRLMLSKSAPKFHQEKPSPISR